MTSAPAALLRADVRRVARDPLLALLSLLPLGLAVAFSLNRDRLVAVLPGSFDLRLITALLLLLTPMMFGLVYGLVLLEERDEGVLTAIAVTPLGRTGFLRRRMTAPFAWTLLASLAIAFLTSRGAMSHAVLGAAALLAGLQAPMLALFVSAFAGDRVQGMALAKGGSALIGVGAVAALAPHPFRWLAAPSPHFWLLDVLLASPATPVWLARLSAAVAVHCLVLLLLKRRFERYAD
jgi:fluoroquinolone transport system permease protein